VRAGAEEARLRFYARDRAQQGGPMRRIVEPVVDVGEPLADALDRGERRELEAGGADLCGELVRQMEVRRREPARVARGIQVAAVGQLAFEDLLELRIAQVTLLQAVDGGGKA
jgi:hypothetical protein